MFLLILILIFPTKIAGSSAHRRVGIPSGWSYGQKGPIFNWSWGPIQPRNFTSSGHDDDDDDDDRKMSEIHLKYVPIYRKMHKIRIRYSK